MNLLKKILKAKISKQQKTCDPEKPAHAQLSQFAPDNIKIQLI